MTKSMMSEMLKEMKKIRMENKKILKELSEIKVNKDEKEKSLDNKACWQCILFYMKPNKRIALGYQYREFRSLEKSVPLKLRWLTISKNAISWDHWFQLKFNEENKKSDVLDSLYPISVFVGDDDSRWNTEDAVRNAVFEMFAGRSNFKVGYYWSEIIIPFELNIYAEEVHISPKEEKHARNIFKTIAKVDYVLIKDFESVTDINYDWVQKSRVELVSTRSLPANLHPLPFFPMAPRWQTFYFDYDTSKCEGLIERWGVSGQSKHGSRLNIVINELREEVTIRRILDSPFLARNGFVRVSDEELRCPSENFFELRLTVRECHGDFSREFFNIANFDRYICVESLPPRSAFHRLFAILLPWVSTRQRGRRYRQLRLN